MYTTPLVPSILMLVSAALTVLASPPPSKVLAPPSRVERSAAAVTSFCGQWDSVTTSNFILYNDLWGESSATSGSQCTTLETDGGSTISWQSAWTWQGGSSQVKSYANAVLNIGAVQMSAISSIPVTWAWSYSGSSIVADVAWDAFLASTASTSATHNYEIMVWLAALGGAAPIGYPNSIATVTIGGVSFNLYTGNIGWTVFSFVATSQAASFSGDFNQFFKYLTQNQGVPSSYYLQSIGAGTETFTGSGATFSVSKYSISLSSTGSGGGTTTSTSASRTSTTTRTSTSTGSASSGTASPYGQCGGLGYSGPKACPSGWTCTVANPYYSQCIQ